jgi:hypothetical protein
MPYDLIDRRARGERRAEFSEDLDEGRATCRASLWSSLGFDRGGSPELSDHAAALALVEAAVGTLAARVARPTSRRVVRWATADGPACRVIESPTRSTRYGAQRDPARNLRAYLLVEVLGLSLAEVGRRIGGTKSAAQRAKKAGALLVEAFARTRSDPRRPSVAGRPFGRNERPW